MFIWSKAPTRGLGTVTKNLRKSDSTSRENQKTLSASFATTTCLETSHTSHTRSTSTSSLSKERQRAEREQLKRLLKESPGKRDARNFLKQFDAPKSGQTSAKSKSNSTSTSQSPAPETAQPTAHNEWGSMRIGVNLGGLYKPTVFAQQPAQQLDQTPEQEEPVHLALVKLRLPQILDDRTLGGIALTLSQMAQLGLSTAVVLDCDEDVGTHTTQPDLEHANLVTEQADRLLAALEEHHEPGPLLVEHVLSYSKTPIELSPTAQPRGGVQVENGYLIFPPVHDGVIPVITPFAYDKELKKVRVQADDVILALIRDVAGLTLHGSDSAESTGHVEARKGPETLLSLDRIIVLDPLGGIPSENRADGAHAFVNLAAEYREIKKELRRLMLTVKDYDNSQMLTALGTPFSKSTEDAFVSLQRSRPQQRAGNAPSRHLQNLQVVQRGLKMLPSSSSGLILTPSEAATKAIPDDAQSTPSKNPLLHNLLTDKSMVSSSLPTTPATHFLGSAMPNPPTFLKKGMPLTMIPDPRSFGPWQPPTRSNPSIELSSDPRIDFSKLVDLINDSFQRKLDADAYLQRIQGRVAGIIIAGDYEGGAICTWETPSALLHIAAPDRPTPDSPFWIPYLDKFAVLTSSQGSGGVSDIVWAALVRTCFPDGVVWRSRTSNPVNSWYKERCNGMWNLPGDQWTMFWTTHGVQHGWNNEQWGEAQQRDMRKWEAYIDVCSGIQPSWADGKKQLD
ncbi:Amino-acid acetyltransferase, mitochondrial [Coniothyrium glycines]